MRAVEISENSAAGSMPPRLQEGIATERIQIVAPSTWVDRIEEWRRKQQPRIPSKSEAIRILVDRAIEAERRK